MRPTLVFSLLLTSCGRDSSPAPTCTVELVFDAESSDEEHGLLIYQSPLGACATAAVSNYSGSLAWRLEVAAPPSPGRVTAATAGPGRREEYQDLTLADGSTASDRMFDLRDGGAWVLPWTDIAESAFAVEVMLPPGSEPSLYPRRVEISLRTLYE